jgi:hypothetical protein
MQGTDRQPAGICRLRVPGRLRDSQPHGNWVDRPASAELDTVARADIVGAGGDQAPVHAVMAEVAFLGNSFGGVEGDRAVRAGVETCLAPGAGLLIQYNDAVGALGDRLRGTRPGAGRIVAVSAYTDSKRELKLSSHPLRAVLPNRDQLDPVRGSVLLLAGHLAGPAAPAEIFPYLQSNRSHGVSFRSG